MKKISSKIFLIILSVIILLTSSILYFTYNSVKDFYFNSLENELVTLSKTMEYKLVDVIQENDTEKLDSMVVEIGNNIKNRITVVKPSGLVIADSEEDKDLMDNHIDRPEIITALEKGIGSSRRYSNTLNKDMFYVANSIERNGEIIAILRVSIFTEDIQELLDTLQFRMLLISTIVLVISLLIAMLLTRNITKPIKLLSQATAKVALGDFKINVNPKGKDEVSILSRNFDLMTRKLEELFDKVVTQNDELNTIITSIQEGMVVLDSEGKIMLSNSVFSDIVETENIYGKKFKKVIKNKEFKELFKDTQENKNYRSRQIEVADNFFLANANYIESKDEVLILFHDITEIKRLEQIKRDFVINVSHELRTPLTAIKGFVETIYTEVQDNHDAIHYLDIIKRHTNRLIDLVQDLLILGEVEKQESNLIISEFNLIKFASNTLKLFDQRVNLKNIKLIFDYTADDIRIQADQFKIEQLLINLIDNAIKYTDQGTIKLFIKKSKTKAHIIVEDTGIGIPKEDLDRIFERFYLVSKSRTRKEGGTGLGLSIVKHIVLNHRGSINVESEFGKGTKFIVKLPLLNADLLDEAQEG